MSLVKQYRILSVNVSKGKCSQYSGEHNVESRNDGQSDDDSGLKSAKLNLDSTITDFMKTSFLHHT